jgi:hypothetical protein
MRPVSECVLLTRELLATGRTSLVKDNVLNLSDCRVDLTGFKDPQTVEVQLFGEDYKILAPDSGLDSRFAKQTGAMVLLECGAPVIAFVTQENIDQPGRFKPRIVVVNIHEPRAAIAIQGRSGQHILNNKDWSDGGLDLFLFCAPQGQISDKNRLAVVKAKGTYVLSVQANGN